MALLDLDFDGFFAAVNGDSFLPFTSAPAALGPTAEAPLTVALDAEIPSDLSSHLSPDSDIAGGEGQSESPEAPPTFFQGKGRFSDRFGICLIIGQTTLTAQLTSHPILKTNFREKNQSLQCLLH